MSEARQQAYIEAPVEIVWDLLADVDRHPEWWPRVLEVECDGLEPGCTYRQVTQTPMGKDEMNLHVDSMDDCRNLVIRCVNTGTFVRWTLAEAQDGTFVDATFGMEPFKLQVPRLRLDHRPPLLPQLAGRIPRRDAARSGRAHRASRLRRLANAPALLRRPATPDVSAADRVRPCALSRMSGSGRLAQSVRAPL